MPRVSVVTGFYNRANVLERTIESVLGQEYEDFELIVFDDASDDGTAARLSELSRRYGDERLRVIVHEQNRGFVRGLVDAIEMSRGEYIAIQGSGDVSLPNRLGSQVALLDERPTVGAVGGWYYNVQEGLGTRRLRQPDADSTTYEDLLDSNVFSHGEVMIRRSVYEAVGGYRTEFKFAQDIDLWLRVRRVASLATVPAPIYSRYVQFDGVSYVPKKIVEQTCYSIAARRLSQMSESEETAALAQMGEFGPTRVVGVDDPIVQQKVARAVVRLAVFGSTDAAQVLAQSSVTDPRKKRLLERFVRVYGSRAFTPFTPLVRRSLGMGRRGD
jgi:glycosyltransferase involved in cell wall biosynthesis